MLCYQKDYPRPQFVRKDWTNLNGNWDFGFDDDNKGEAEGWYEGFQTEREICVPFTYETKKSNIHDQEVHHFVWYSRRFQAQKEKLSGNKLFLHFEGSDFLTKVWINGKFAGMHEGGYSRFSFDITNLVKDGENLVTVKAEDHMDPQQPRGKQRWVSENFGCWYVQTTGIWKTVWMEYVPDICLSSVKMTPNLPEGRLELEYTVDCPAALDGRRLEVEAVVSFEGRFITRTITGIGKNPTKVSIDLEAAEAENPWGIRTWTPAAPQLYDISFCTRYDGEVCDEAGSYFGMREIRIDGPNILLNGAPLYQRLILDQGYWEETHLTPPDEDALIEDIDKIHALGYNGLRKHQKTEDERFLYWCDVKGMLVWSEAPAAYIYSDRAVELFTGEWLDIVKQNYNHPSIITWTPINESWGVPQIETSRKQQHFTEGIYHLTKSVDQYRPVIVNDGWEHTVSDIITLHDYEEKGEVLRKRYTEYKAEIMTAEVYHSTSKSAFANGFSYRGQPVMISEFGGIAFDSDKEGWGYGNKVNTKEDFLKRFESITTAIKEIPYVCGYCYTQVTDVQQEVNGLMDIRRNFKVDPEKVKEINEKRVAFWRNELR
ncbi:glycoside hydrolase family 2 protein [Lacrimispora indolis]|uniref:glycoside hydrolase family 2 protein n=1 Tax=Lacrimispora indolis TaxID=69825 RepID=UPI000410632D|nr:sugar-binding domain-containing protein [[Clostridium] methoxybenzovorans]